MAENADRAHEALAEDFERDLHTERQMLNMGPSPPAHQRTVQILVELDGANTPDPHIQV